ncbi:DUF2341 domain-containing protein [Anatilimnocola floriformis]|uniref:DUF2341 domain-containing protein n=1 Tax=Anatilimnocola floriformis TaxID=2948575 RepID=UPI0020C24DDE|nr:DUF2341 domain-containing protein [Anatilimnocola floriformis]
MLRAALFVGLVVWSLLPSIGFAQAKSEPYQDWKQRGEFWLLTTPEGAHLPAEAVCENFPVLVRLHRDFFDFKQAQPQGEDIRFATSSGESIAHQIEEWNADQGTASVWVRVPKITGNARQMLRMFWGNAAAKSESNGAAVFNSSNGYVAAWHMNEPANDAVGTLTTTDTGTTASQGMIGSSRHFLPGKGLTAGEKIESLPQGSESHSTEAWFRAEKPNVLIVSWGNEHAKGKVVVQYRSPPHAHVDCYFSGGNVNGAIPLSTGDWHHVVHTYEKGEAKLYVNGQLDVTNKGQGPPLEIKRPARLWIGGWYNNYQFTGDIDEVRISSVVRSAEWIKLQFENQKPQQTLVGPLVQTGDAFSVSTEKLEIGEGKTADVSVKAGGAQKIYWILKRGEQESLVATDRFAHTFAAGRVTGDSKAQLIVRAVYPSEVKSKTIDISIREAIAEPQFTLDVPATWNGRKPLEIAPKISNADAVKQAGVPLEFQWSADDVAVIKQASDKLQLKRAQGDGLLRIKLAVSNGGEPVVKTTEIRVTQPQEKDKWLPQPIAEREQPEDGQFIAREGASAEGTIVYAGTLLEPAEVAFLRIYADDKLVDTLNARVTPEKQYGLTAKIKAGLVKYRTEFGVKQKGEEKVLHTATNIVCGDAFIITGQSNAVANDFGKENPLVPNEWVRTFGATDGGPGSRLKKWAPAEARAPGGKAEIGFWGMELGRRLVESRKMPICIINGAVGGTRIDQHIRNDEDPTDIKTIYGRLLWRVQEARLTHGVRGIIWHQGESDQGSDGPTGTYGFETYQQFFVDLAGSWKSDFPNVEHYFTFQIWPKSCSMGINGSDNRLREVQRNMPGLFSNLSIMSTCGVKPPGGCHFPAAGYAEFARLIQPQVETHLYGKPFKQPINPPNLQKAYFTSDKKDELALEFDQPVVWQDSLVNQFHLISEPKQVESGAAVGNKLTLKLKAPSKATQVTYLDSAAWNPDNLLIGANGIAALTFCEAAIER